MEAYMAEMVGSTLVDGSKKAIGMIAKTLIEHHKLEKIFVDAGRTVSAYERDKTEENELRAIAFCESNMKLLAGAMGEANEFLWEATLEGFLDNLLSANAMSQVNRERCKRHFMEIVIKDIEGTFARIMERSYIRETRDNSEAILENLASQNRVMNRLSYGISRLLDEKMQESQGYARQEKSDRIRAGVGEMGISRGAQAEWKIQSLHIKGIFDPPGKQRDEILFLTEVWKREREQYPGWYIMPRAVQERLYWNTRESGLLQQKEQVSLNERLEFCYEYVWRCERGMFLYDGRIQRDIRSIWEDYRQLPENIVTNESLEHWFYIGQVLLREYREDGEAGDWQAVYRALKEYAEESDSWAAELRMEAIKYAFSVMDISKVIRELRQWKIPKEQFVLRLQAIGLLAECGELDEAMLRFGVLKQEIVESIKDGEGDYALFLQTLCVCMLQLESLMLQGYAHGQREYEQNQEEINGIVEQIEAGKHFFHWQEIIDHMTEQLLDGYVKRYEKAEVFELNRESKTIAGGSSKEGEAAYYLYRVLDALALPLQINHVTLLSHLELPWMGALLRINTRLALFMLVRGSKADTCRKLIQRRYLAGMKQSEAVSVLRFLMAVLDKNLVGIAEKRSFYEGNIYGTLSLNVPGLLSRFMTRCPEYLQKDALLLVKRMMEYEEPVLENRMNEFLVGMMAQISERVKAEMLGTLLNAQMQEHPSPLKEGIALDFFDCYFSKADRSWAKNICRVGQEQIEELFAGEESSLYVWRTKVVRLEALFDLGLLSKEQEKRFGKLIWSRINERTMLPDLPNHYVWGYMEMPHGEGDMPVFSIKEFFLKSGLMKILGAEEGCKITMGEIPYLDELGALAREMEKDFWTVEEVEWIFADAIAYWQVLREKLFKATSDVTAWELKRRAGKMVRTLAEVYNSITGKLSADAESEVREMLGQMRAAEIDVLQLEVLFEGENSRIIEQIKRNMYSAENTVTVDAISAAYLYILKYPKEHQAAVLLGELQQLLRAGKNPGLVSAIVILHNLWYTDCAIMTEQIAIALDGCLIELEKRTRYEEHMVDEREIKSAISARRACVSLAFQMYRKMGGSCGEGVQLWKTIAEGEEFAEVKNEWYC